ncbi:MAG: hypothetical protein S4CHLAM123_10740 [Chlamydiales bacterium]|nr:hypothetical protein [Chlamydiales bacterium]
MPIINCGEISISSAKRFLGGFFQKKQDIQSVYEHIETLAHSSPSIVIPQVEKYSKGKYFLTGKVRVQNLKFGSSELHQNLESAQKIIKQVQDTIFYSSNYPQRSKVIRKFSKQGRADSIFRALYEDEIKVGRKKLQYVRQSNIFDTKNKVGNCGEMAVCGLYYARQLKIAAERWYIGGGDHTFLVIGHSQSSWSSNYRSWDSVAVICDPWSGSLFPVTHIEMYLKNYIGLSKINGIYKTQIESFDPRKHELLRSPVFYSEK